MQNLVYGLKQIPFTLSPANSCANYLFSESLLKNLSPEALELIKYLTKVDLQVDKTSTNKSFNKKLLEKLDELVKGGLFFVNELLASVADPQYGHDKYTGSYGNNNPSLQLQVEEVDLFSHEESLEIPLVNESIDINETAPISIKSRLDALDAVEEAILLIKIRLLSPVEGHQNALQRYEG